MMRELVCKLSGAVHNTIVVVSVTGYTCRTRHTLKVYGSAACLEAQ